MAGVYTAHGGLGTYLSSTKFEIMFGNKLLIIVYRVYTPTPPPPRTTGVRLYYVYTDNGQCSTK